MWLLFFEHFQTLSNTFLFLKIRFYKPIEYLGSTDGGLCPVKRANYNTVRISTEI